MGSAAVRIRLCYARFCARASDCVKVEVTIPSGREIWLRDAAATWPRTRDPGATARTDGARTMTSVPDTRSTTALAPGGPAAVGERAGVVNPAQTDPERLAFWEDAARRLRWEREWDRAHTWIPADLETDTPPVIRWFEGGTALLSAAAGAGADRKIPGRAIDFDRDRPARLNAVDLERPPARPTASRIAGSSASEVIRAMLPLPNEAVHFAESRSTGPGVRNGYRAAAQLDPRTMQRAQGYRHPDRDRHGGGRSCLPQQYDL